MVKIIIKIFRKNALQPLITTWFQNFFHSIFVYIFGANIFPLFFCMSCPLSLLLVRGVRELPEVLPQLGRRLSRPLNPWRRQGHELVPSSWPQVSNFSFYWTLHNAHKFNKNIYINAEICTTWHLQIVYFSFFIFKFNVAVLFIQTTYISGYVVSKLLETKLHRPKTCMPF